MVIVARNYEAVRKLNYIISVANEDGYYYRPRIDLSLLLTLSPDDVYVTSACVAGWKYEDADEIWIKIFDHFGSSFYFEYQAHATESQIKLNSHIKELADNFGVNTIAGLDTHYINEEDRIKRENLLLRKGLHHSDEESWYMDWPTGQELFDRFKNQGVLSDEEIITSMLNTHVFVDGCKSFDLSTDFKIPVLPQYSEMSYEERAEELKRILNEQYKKEDSEHRTPDRIDGIRYEVNQIIDSGIVDYFLDDFHIVKLATSDEYGGHLTTTSRGSAASYYSSKLLGLTTIDRFEAEVPIYPERFMTTDRILASHQCADVDLNCSEQEPFVKASRDLLGSESCYPLLAVGKLKEKSAFKLYAGVNDIDPQVANDVTTLIDKYNDALKHVDEEDKDSIRVEQFIKDDKLLSIYRESLPYQNIVEQAKCHACGHFLFNGDVNNKDVIGYGDVRYEVGLIRCVSESTGNSVVVACVEGSLLDKYGYVKNDYLIVDVVSIISKLYASIGMQVPPVSELRKMVEDDDLTWDLYAKGITCCLNQCENPGTTAKATIYKPKTVKELAAFVAAIRPGFKSLIDGFLNRESYSSGEEAIDNILEDCFHYMVYQEAVMSIFAYLGIPMKDAYDTIKKISKKKLVGKELEKVENILKEHWLENIGNLDNFEPVYQVIKDSARYSFNGPHALSMAFDSLYEAWMKAHHTSKFYEVTLNHYQSKGDKDKISALIKEAKDFFGYSLGEYEYGNDHTKFTVDDTTKTIYPSLVSIKGIGEQAAADLARLSENEHESIFDVLQDIQGTKINKTVMASLSSIGFFKKFGGVNKIHSAMGLYDKYMGRSTLNKAEAPLLRLSHEQISKYATDVLNSGKISEKRYTIFNNAGLVKEAINAIPDTDATVVQKAQSQCRILGNTSIADESVDKRICIVTELDTKYSPKFVAYCINNGKTQVLKVHNKKDGRNNLIKESFDRVPFENGDVIYLKSCKKEPKKRKVNGEWVAIPGVFEWWVNDYSVIK